MAAASVYTEELADSICEKMATTSLGLRHICELNNVNHATVRRWIADKEHPMCDKYTRAKKLQIDYLAEETLDIADDGSNDLMLLTNARGEQYEQENKEVTSRSKLRVETRKWLLSKLAPKIYGDKLDVTTGGEKLPTTINIIRDNGSNGND